MPRTGRRKSEQLKEDYMLLAGIDLSFGEAAMLCEALRGLWLSPKFIERIWRQMRSLIRTEELEEKWSADCDVLAARLSKLRRSEATAILRAAIRFWERHEEPTAELLRDIGLLHPKKETSAVAVKPARKGRRPSPGKAR